MTYNPRNVETFALGEVLSFREKYIHVSYNEIMRAVMGEVMHGWRLSEWKGTIKELGPEEQICLRHWAKYFDFYPGEFTKWMKKDIRHMRAVEKKVVRSHGG